MLLIDSLYKTIHFKGIIENGKICNFDLSFLNNGKDHSHHFKADWILENRLRCHIWYKSYLFLILELQIATNQL